MPTRPKFLFPVRVMGALFRGKMLDALERAHARGHINLGDLDLRALRKKSWVVYAKRPFGGPEQVIRYLGRYTHRVGISNQRLLGMDERGVTFRTKDGNAVTLTGEPETGDLHLEFTAEITVQLRLGGECWRA